MEIQSKSKFFRSPLGIVIIVFGVLILLCTCIAGGLGIYTYVQYKDFSIATYEINGKNQTFYIPKELKQETENENLLFGELRFINNDEGTKKVYLSIFGDDFADSINSDSKAAKAIYIDSDSGCKEFATYYSDFLVYSYKYGLSLSAELSNKTTSFSHETSRIGDFHECRIEFSLTTKDSVENFSLRIYQDSRGDKERIHIQTVSYKDSDKNLLNNINRGLDLYNPI